MRDNEDGRARGGAPVRAPTIGQQHRQQRDAPVYVRRLCRLVASRLIADRSLAMRPPKSRNPRSAPPATPE